MPGPLTLTLSPLRGAREEITQLKPEEPVMDHEPSRQSISLAALPTNSTDVLGEGGVHSSLELTHRCGSAGPRPSLWLVAVGVDQTIEFKPGTARKGLTFGR